jgi:hypothetical protein
VPRRKHKTGRISVFKGREAKLNRAIFQTLAHKSPQTAWDVFRHFKKQKDMVHLTYWVLIRRVRALQELDYLMKVGERKTMPGSETALYQLTPRAELAMALDQIDLDKFIREADYHRILSALEAFQTSGTIKPPNIL